jgi:hypothetical protein
MYFHKTQPNSIDFGLFYSQVSSGAGIIALECIRAKSTIEIYNGRRNHLAQVSIDLALGY